MKRSILLIIFVVSLIGLFVWLALNRNALSLSTETRQNAKTIVPSAENEPNVALQATDEGASYDESKAQPLIALADDETFLQAISADLNKDGVTDQICAIKKASEPNIFFVPGIQDPITTQYSRLQAIRTGVTQARTILFYFMDIVGDHSNALICSGMTADNLQLLAVYLPVTETNGELGFTAIADLRADGSISIQESARSDAYALGLTSGESYPICTYTSDPDAPQTLDQVERVYRWDKSLKRYEKASESRIEGKRIESRLVKQLQDGDLESFENFLGGLWYMTSSASTGGNRYLFFNPAETEIIFHNSSTEEVYIRESGSARRYGAYLTTRNRSISSIRRLIDIELTGLDEIRIKVLEDVKLKIGVASDWDGVYRKMGTGTTSEKSQVGASAAEIQKTLSANPEDWISSDGQTLRMSGQEYTLTRADGAESGRYAVLTVQGKPIIQFRTGGAPQKTSFYLASLATKPTTGSTGQRQTLILTEIGVSIEGTALAGSPPAVFERSIRQDSQSVTR